MRKLVFHKTKGSLQSQDDNRNSNTLTGKSTKHTYTNSKVSANSTTKFRDTKSFKSNTNADLDEEVFESYADTMNDYTNC